MAAESVYEKLNRIALNGHPTVASIEVTARCNARCGYCYLKDRPFKELSTGQLCAALEKFSKNGIILTEKHLDFLIRNREFFIEMQMSVFSHIPAKNDAYFGVPGAFDTIMKNALFLKENGIKVRLAMSIFD